MLASGAGNYAAAPMYYEILPYNAGGASSGGSATGQ
jgi:hypothetical protein